MGGLDINEITIGYSSTGAAKYVDDLNTQAIVETSTMITNSVSTITDALREGWQGKACDAYVQKLSESGEALKEKLKEMEKVFNAMLAAQEETYNTEDESMADNISSSTIF